MKNSFHNWITTKELAQIKGISERAVRKAIGKNKYVIRKCSKSYEILITSLEENVREKLAAKTEKTPQMQELIHEVPEEQKKLALAKYDLIKKWDEYRNQKKNKTLAGKEFIEMYNNKFICSELYELVKNVAIGTIYEWHKRLRTYNDDWHCLINNYTFGEKTKKSALSKLEEELFLKIPLHPNQINIGKAIKMTKSFLMQRGINQFCCDMTYRRFAALYKKEHYDTLVLAREGSKALNDKVIPYIKRDISQIEPGDVLIGMQEAKNKLGKYRHLYDRISEIVEFKPFSKVDADIIIDELSEIKITDEAKEIIFERINRFRQLIKCISGIENLAKTNELKAIKAKHVKGLYIE